MRAIIKFKDFHGHAGIPGHQGGALPRDRAGYYEDTKYDDYVSYMTVDPSNGKSLAKPSDDVLATVSSAMHNINRVYDTGPIVLTGGTLATMGTEFGHHTRVQGHDIMALNLDKIRDYAKRANWDWLGMNPKQGDTADDIIQHVIAHEYGHQWWQERIQRSDKLLPIPGGHGNKGLIDLSPVHDSWKNLWASNRSDMSGYSRYLGSPQEAFSDAFANYVNGYDQAGPVEDWLNKNIDSPKVHKQVTVRLRA